MTERLATLRILDANANRAVEGLRVMEEHFRFVLADRLLTETCKQLRHDLAAQLARLPQAELLAARDTPGDVGTRIAASDEYQRATLHDVWEANHRRVEQSLRCLEEFSKPLRDGLAAEFEQLRYRLYTLVKAGGLAERAANRLADARLYVLIDGGSDPEAFHKQAAELVAAGVDVLQLRDKRLADRELLERARLLRSLTRGTPVRFVMNDRPDLAVLADADGVHVGQEELTVADARAIVGTQRWVGVSTHSWDQARRAILDGADYLGCGPTFPSTTKSFAEFPGLPFLREVAERTILPAFAIGGVSATNLPDILATGIRRVAVGAAITQATSPAEMVRQFQAILRG